MGIRGMVSHNAIMLVVLIFINFLCMSAGNIAWTVLGLIALAGILFLTYRHGAATGREACAILDTVNKTHIGDGASASGFDRQYARQAWSASRGVKALFASALVPYVCSCVYIIMMQFGDGTEVHTIIARAIAWILNLPFWPAVAWKYEVFTSLDWPIVLVLMVGPFVVPAFTCFGYLQGPELWKKTEEAMAKGKRRAKARSRIVKKNKQRVQKPQI